MNIFGSQTKKIWKKSPKNTGHRINIGCPLKRHRQAKDHPKITTKSHAAYHSIFISSHTDGLNALGLANHIFISSHTDGLNARYLRTSNLMFILSHTDGLNTRYLRTSNHIFILNHTDGLNTRYFSSHTDGLNARYFGTSNYI